jgi:hypothetical protein
MAPLAFRATSSLARVGQRRRGEPAAVEAPNGWHWSSPSCVRTMGADPADPYRPCMKKERRARGHRDHGRPGLDRPPLPLPVSRRPPWCGGRFDGAAGRATLHDHRPIGLVGDVVVFGWRMGARPAVDDPVSGAWRPGCGVGGHGADSVVPASRSSASPTAPTQRSGVRQSPGTVETPLRWFLPLANR